MKEHRENHLGKQGITEEEFWNLVNKHQKKSRVDKSKELYVNNLQNYDENQLS